MKTYNLRTFPNLQGRDEDFITDLPIASLSPIFEFSMLAKMQIAFKYAFVPACINDMLSYYNILSRNMLEGALKGSNGIKLHPLDALILAMPSLVLAYHDYAVYQGAKTAFTDGLNVAMTAAKASGGIIVADEDALTYTWSPTTQFAFSWTSAGQSVTEYWRTTGECDWLVGGSGKSMEWTTGVFAGAWYMDILNKLYLQPDMTGVTPRIVTFVAAQAIGYLRNYDSMAASTFGAPLSVTLPKVLERMGTYIATRSRAINYMRPYRYVGTHPISNGSSTWNSLITVTGKIIPMPINYDDDMISALYTIQPPIPTAHYYNNYSHTTHVYGHDMSLRNEFTWRANQLMTSFYLGGLGDYTAWISSDTNTNVDYDRIWCNLNNTAVVIQNDVMPYASTVFTDRTIATMSFGSSQGTTPTKDYIAAEPFMVALRLPFSDFVIPPIRWNPLGNSFIHNRIPAEYSNTGFDLSTPYVVRTTLLPGMMTAWKAGAFHCRRELRPTSFGGGTAVFDATSLYWRSAPSGLFANRIRADVVTTHVPIPSHAIRSFH